MILPGNIDWAVSEIMPGVIKFLSDLIRFDSTPGNEHEAMEYLYEKFNCLDIEVEKIYLENAIKNDKDYSFPIIGISYDNRFNLYVCKKGCGNGRKLLFNTHVDVVPPSEGMVEPWNAKIENGAFKKSECILIIKSFSLLFEEINVLLFLVVINFIFVFSFRWRNAFTMEYLFAAIFSLYYWFVSWSMFDSNIVMTLFMMMID